MHTTPDILDAPVRDLLEAIASDVPSPGGGSAAALAGAMAAGLVAMTARRSVDEWEWARGMAAQAEALRARLGPLAQADADAYEQALVAMHLPPHLEPEVRNATIAQALDRAAEVPLAIAEHAADVAELAAVLAEYGNPDARGDATAAALLAEAGARAAGNLVRINLGATPDDDRVQHAADVARAATAAAGRALEAGP